MPGTPLRLLFGLAALTLVAAPWTGKFPDWGDAPVPKPGETFASPNLLHAHRELSIAAPSDDATALVHIIGWSSLGMTVIFFFAAMALCNMQVEGDSLLYSKAKAE